MKSKFLQTSFLNLLGFKKPKQRRRNKYRDDSKLKSIWLKVRKEYFPDRPDLDEYTVNWSRRPQLRTLASCSLEIKKINVARELNYQKYTIWLEPLLYHEMCHAYLGDSIRSKYSKTAWHGKEFRALERRHPMIKELDKWIKQGGWHTAIRSDRTIRYHKSKNAA